MNFKEIYEETANRGFDDMLRSPAQLVRLKRYVNEAHRELCDGADWPFLEATKEGPAPLTIADLGHVLSLSNLTADQPCEPLDRRRVVDSDPGLDDTGTGQYWYREGESTIKVSPGDTTSTFAVRYVKAVVPMVVDGDLPLPPVQYHGLIATGAVVRCMINRKNYEAAQFERQEWQLGVKGMKHALLKPNHDRPKRVAKRGRAEDYLG